jgi:ADP-dependent glucokinase
LIGNRFADLGISVFLGGPVGETLSPLLNPSIRIQQDEQNPIQDEIHLILEFATGQTWENLVSPRANRFIVSHDIQNSQLSFVEKFHQELQSPQLAVLAGAHLLEALNEPLRSERLSALANAISSIPKEIVVHLEIAGVGNATFLADFAQKILPLVDSIGLNEQELGMLYSALGGQEFQSSDFVSPLLRTASRSIGFIMGLPMFLNNQGDHQLNRVHLHFLSYHLIAQPVQSREGVYQWDREKAKASVASGSLATTIQACGVDGEFPDVAQLRVDPRVANSGSFEEFNLEFWVSPVVICKVPIRTVGESETSKKSRHLHNSNS